MGNLYFGDNLEVLREHIGDETVDLVYLDPPFNSKRDYNLLFKTPKGHNSEASITAFEDSWHWGTPAELEFSEILHQANTDVAEMMQALRRFLGENDMMAYLVMMCNRLLELHRVLKPTGSLYLHCDPTAGHYLKIVLDGIFGKENYRNEIIWKRTGAHSSAKKYAPVHDTIFYYSKTDSPLWNAPRLEYTEEYLDRYYKYDDGDGRLYWRNSLTASGVRSGSSGKDWKGFSPSSQGAHWKFTTEKLDELDGDGLIYWPPNGGWPQIKRYRDELKGIAISDLWDDIDKINPAAKERLGYPTQKPLALLERIIKASCPPDGIVLDPFCGCGTAVHAAQTLGRKWIGIDITNLAISIIETRLRKHFPNIHFDTHGTPRDLDGARDLARRDKYEFQYWVCQNLLGATPHQNKKKGADGGIDGIIYFQDVGNQHKKIIVSVKGGENLNVSMIRDLGHVISREKAEIGLFVTLSPPTRPMKEEAASAGFYAPPFVGAEFPRIQILTIEELLNGHQPRYPSLARGGIANKARKGQAGKQLSLLLPYEGKKVDETVITEASAPVLRSREQRRVNQRCEIDD